MSTWTLSRGSTSRTLAQWGITQPKISPRSLAVSEFTFQIIRENALAEATFQINDELSLALDGVRKFNGKVTRAYAFFEGGENGREGDRYVVSDVWFDLERTIYQQPRTIATIVTGAVTAYTTPHTSHVTLHQDQFGTKISLGAQIRAINAYALSQGISYVQGTAPDLITVPLETARDITCAEAIRRCLMWQPDAVAWFDYSTSAPTLHFQVRSSLTGVSLDLTAGAVITSGELTARKDLVPAGVVFNFVSTQEGAAPPVGGGDDIIAQFDKITQQTAGAIEGPGVVVATIDLSRDISGAYESPPAGLAAAYYALLINTPYEGTIRLKGREVSSLLSLGKVMNFTNGRTEWSTMNALLQTANFDLTAGEAEFDFGPPEHLSPQDFVSLLMINRKSAAPPVKGDFPKVQADGESGHTNNNAGVSPNTSKTSGNLGSTDPVTVCPN